MRERDAEAGDERESGEGREGRGEGEDRHKVRGGCQSDDIVDTGPWRHGGYR